MAIQEDKTDNSRRGMTMIAGEEEELELLVVQPVCAGFVYHNRQAREMRSVISSQINLVEGSESAGIVFS
jgi:hypothetical protein